MHRLNVGILVVVAVFVAYALKSAKQTNNDVDGIKVSGTFDRKFGIVADMFRLNLEEGWERGGAGFVVYHKGKKVVDIWGGYADRDAKRLWKQDTLNVAFSCSKAIGALAVAKLVDDGHISYDDLVTKIWPEFGKHGKQNVTVRWVLEHKAGLAYTDHPISVEDAKSAQKMDEIFENQKPQWPPGTEMGYHAVTYGWLVDGIVRRADPNKRTLSKYFQEEIAKKHNIEFHLGLPLELQHRVSRLSNPTIYNVIEELIHEPHAFNIRRFVSDRLTNGTLSKVELSTPWLRFVKDMTVNDPDLHRLEQAGALGISTARSMAQLFELVRTNKILSPSTTSAFLDISSPAVEDLVTGAVVSRGQGLMLKKFVLKEKTIRLIGHSGYGGQNVRVDLENEIVFSYVSNALKVGFGDTARTYKRLLNAVYETVIDS